MKRHEAYGILASAYSHPAISKFKTQAQAAEAAVLPLQDTPLTPAQIASVQALKLHMDEANANAKPAPTSDAQSPTT